MRTGITLRGDELGISNVAYLYFLFTGEDNGEIATRGIGGRIDGGFIGRLHTQRLLGGLEHVGQKEERREQRILAEVGGGRGRRRRSRREDERGCRV
jgi:hypothetical protein